MNARIKLCSTLLSIGIISSSITTTFAAKDNFIPQTFPFYESAVATTQNYLPAPENFRITNRGGLSVQFSWNGTSGARYAIYRKHTGASGDPVKILETISTTVSVETLFGSCDFYVAQIDADGNRISYFSNSKTVEAFLPAPENFRITNRGGLSVQFSWNGTSGARYAIYRKHIGTSGDPVKILETTSTTVSVETLFGSCDFYVAQIDADGNRTSYFSISKTVEAFLPAPENFRITNRSGLTIQLSWNGESGAKYAIYRKVSGTSSEPVKILETTNSTVSVETLLGSCDFYVVKVDDDGNRISYFSNLVTVQS